MSMLIPENESISEMSEMYESNFTNQDSRMNASRGEFDTTIVLDMDSNSHVIDAMFQDFLSFFQSYSGEQEVFDLLLNYEELCCTNFAAVSKLLMKSNSKQL
ncbi:hypothetical protein HNY73_018158 [Argiope bruennichi]|uniref:Uncharacterized protein n=1 Tax=Argiope bruennichi TaxID=94029 RepID=A0A8T0EG19_ARGBR|nr:hypothetical protein HNY73_018158 [Argiope bruennichi]